MLSESVLSVRKELFPQNKTAVSDMPKVNIQKKVQPTDADMVQTSLSFENIYYSLWEIAGRYSSFCQFRVIGNSHDERMIPMLEVGTGSWLLLWWRSLRSRQELPDVWFWCIWLRFCRCCGLSGAFPDSLSIRCKEYRRHTGRCRCNSWGSFLGCKVKVLNVLL